MNPLNPTPGKTTLAAIVFTDAVGFSSYAREDESGALDAIASDHAAMRRLCTQHDGRVVKSTGDGLLLMFDSAASAFQCALEILRELPDSPLRHRIGLHLGDVTTSDGDVMGDGVNVASRLQELARPGEMCASQTVVDVVQSRLKFALRPMGEQVLKNIPQPMRVYAVDPFAIEGRRHPSRPRWNSRTFGFVFATIAVLAVGTPLWMLALRPAAAPTPTALAGGPVTLSPELARYLENGAAPVEATETDAQPEAAARAPTSEEKVLDQKVADLEELQKWFQQRMKAYPKEKPLTLPAKDGAEKAQVWADASKGVVVKAADGDPPDKVRATTFVRATHHLIEKMPEGPEKVALLKRLQSLAVPRKEPDKGGRPSVPAAPDGLAVMTRSLPLPRDFKEHMAELGKINLSIAEELKEFGPDRPFKLESAGRPPLLLWFDQDGELVGDTGDGAAAPVELATYMRLAREVLHELPPGPKRDEIQKTLDALTRRRTGNRASQPDGQDSVTPLPVPGLP